MSANSAASSVALARARAELEKTPRAIAGELERLGRGDRGCLGDVLSGGGAVLFLLLIATSAAGLIPGWTVYVGLLPWIGGFAYGAVMQSRSGKRRRAILQAAPLVSAQIVRADPELAQSGTRPGRAAVVFHVEESLRFDGAALEKLAEAAALGQDPAVRAFFGDRWAVGCRPVGMGFIADVVLRRDRLDGAVAKVGDVVGVIANPGQGFVEHV